MKLAVRLVVLTISLIVTLGLLELALAVAGFSATPVDIQIGRQFDARTLHVFEDQNFESHPDLIWSPKRSHSVFNSQGFRGPELAAAKPRGELRVFTVGDSNTLGWAGNDGAHWPGDLARLVAGAHPGARVVNAGVWGYASYQGLRRFRQTLAFDPDIVLVSFGSNDAHFVLQSDSDFDAASFRHSEPGRALQRFRLGELILSALDRRSRKKTELGPRVSLDDYRANLTAMVQEGRARGVDVVLLTRPYMGPIDDPYWWKNRGADYNTATAEVAGTLGVPMVDVYSFFKGRDDLFADESHFTAEGHRLAAAVIFDHIRPLADRRAR